MAPLGPDGPPVPAPQIGLCNPDVPPLCRESMTIAQAANRVAIALKTADLKVVFAESCTGGLVSGALTQVPGISAHHCGGMVVYRNATKKAYLNVPSSILKKPGPVSAMVTKYMAVTVLEKTPEADLALAVTGHLGPQAPSELDGQVFVAVAWRRADRNHPKPAVKQIDCQALTTRIARQRFAVEHSLEFLAKLLEGHVP